MTMSDIASISLQMRKSLASLGSKTVQLAAVRCGEWRGGGREGNDLEGESRKEERKVVINHTGEEVTGKTAYKLAL